jgi:hypothetical protein
MAAIWRTLHPLLGVYGLGNPAVIVALGAPGTPSTTTSMSSTGASE